MPDRKPKIFLSYSHKNKEAVREIRKTLVDNDIDIAWDEEFAIGESWSDDMQRNLRAAECVVICWSKAAVESDMVNHEFSIADYDKKHVGIELETGIKYRGIAGSRHHERFHEWVDENRANRIQALTDKIREVAGFQNPAVSQDEIMSYVRRVDRTDQDKVFCDFLETELSPTQSGFSWLFSAHEFDRPDEYIEKIAKQTWPKILKKTKIISDQNDEHYESDVISMEWPDGYRGVDDAIEFLLRSLSKGIPGHNENGSVDLDVCLQRTSSIAPIIYLKIPLAGWAQTDEQVLRELISRLEKVRLDPNNPKHFAFFVVTTYFSNNRMIEITPAGLLGRFRKEEKDIDDILLEISDQRARRITLPRLKKIVPQEVKDWHTEFEKEISVPAEKQNFFEDKIYEPFEDNEHEEARYKKVARVLQEALEYTFLRPRN